MENVLAAIIIIFVLLFGALTLSSAFISAQQTVYDAWEDANSRSDALANTSIALENIRITENGSRIEVTLHNEGGAKLAGFDEWDVFADYYDGSAMPAYLNNRLVYNSSTPATNEWSVAGIYLNADEAIDEVYEPGIFNTGEALVLYLNVSPAIGVGQMAQVTVSTPNGVNSSLVGMRNTPPTLDTNLELRVASGGVAAITSALLKANDIDNDADELVYTIDSAPLQGEVTPETFTQAQINSGEVVYTHTGSGIDSFGFSVSDGLDEIGPFIFTITVNTPPVLSTNAALEIAQGETAVITNALLQATDDDEEDLPGDLIYTITQFPSNGTLNLGSTFSQADIDSNSLTYTHTGTEADLFQFVVSDGYDVIGTTTFIITVVEAPVEP